MNQYKPLFSPIKIGTVEVKNRFALAPMGPLGLADGEGGFNQRGIDYYTERARGGTGLIVTGVTFVDNEIEEHGMPNCPCPTHNPIHFIRTAREMTERIHAYDAKVFLQMSGGFGRVTIPTNLGEFPPVAPSPIPHRWLDKICRELTMKEIRQIVEKFGEGAFHAKRAGFDGVQIHAVHEGYLIDQFAISLFNQRKDHYGGSLENRLRFAREIVEKIKERCGHGFPVTLRYSPKSFIKGLRDGALPGEEFVEMGRDLPEGIEAAKLLVSYGYDALDVDVGSYDSWFWSHPPMYQQKGLYLPFARQIKEAVEIPVLCAGRMDNPDLALEALESGACDMISLGRPLLADPEYVNKLRQNRTAEIRPCISCQEGCMGRIQEYSALNCAVNPQACRERHHAYNPILHPKKVLVVGGGVAGCEAARVLAIRGHLPVLAEKSHRLGGNLLPGGAPDFKEDDLALARWYTGQLELLGVPIRFGETVSADRVLAEEWDSVIIATGSVPKCIPLGDSSSVATAEQILNGEAYCGEKVTVIGGGLVGCETALFLAQRGKTVTLLEAEDGLLSVNGPLCHANSEMLVKLLPQHRVHILLNSRATDFQNGVLEVHQKRDGMEKIVHLEADTAVLAVGYTSNDQLFRELQFEVDDIHLLGDARRVANIMYAVWDAFEVANSL